MAKKKYIKDEWQHVIDELENSSDNKWEGQQIYDLSSFELEYILNDIDSMLCEKETSIRELEQSIKLWTHKAEQRKLNIQVSYEIGKEDLTLMRYLNDEDEERRYSPFFAPKQYWNSARNGIVKIPTLIEDLYPIGRTHLENCISWSKSLIDEVSSYKSMETDSESEKSLVVAIHEYILPILEVKLEELEQYHKLFKK